MHSCNFDETLLRIVQEYGETDFSLIKRHMDRIFPTKVTVNELEAFRIENLQKQFCKLTGRPNQQMIMPSACESDDEEDTESSPIKFDKVIFVAPDCDEEACNVTAATVSSSRDPDPYGRCKRQRDFVNSDLL